MSKLLHALTLSRLLAALTFMSVFVMAARPPLDTDTYWHLRAGEWQVEQRALLRVDTFSHTRAGEQWINHSWLSQLAIYGAYAALGDVGLALYTAVLATAGMAFVYPQLRTNAMVRAFVTVLAAASAAIFWSARPQMVSFFLSAVVLYLLWLRRKRGIDRLWLIPPLLALWANVHGGFAIAFILIALSMAGELARWLFEEVFGRGESVRQPLREGLRPAGRLALVGLVSAAAVSLNPYGPRLLLYPFRTVGIGALQDFIQEWASPNFHTPQTWPFIGLLLGTLVIVGLSGQRIDWRDVALVGGTAASALLAARNIATFSIVAAPLLARHLDAWLSGLGVRFDLIRRPRGPVLIVNWVLLGLALAASVLAIGVRLHPAAVAEQREAMLPVEATVALEATRPPGRLFNSYNWGGYLIWTARDYPVAVDGRTDLYDDALLREYLTAYLAQPGWEAVLDAWQVNTVLVERSSPLARVLAERVDWRVVHEDGLASLCVREELFGDGSR